ncbi:MAG TPA: dTMP kinase [Bacteroidales bacterium]|jgi:dTMP kinase|nr:dTMP kinase [Bacteroidales bacterium]
MKLFVIEGVDGSGKSTQIKLLTEYFRQNGLETEFLHFPRMDAPYFGELIARFLRGEFGSLDQVDPYLVALLYAGDRKDAAGMIRNWLDNKKIVLLDRYTYSNIAYQCAKISDEASQDKLMDWILRLEFEHFAIPRPDLNIFLDVPFSFTEKKLLSGRSGADRDYLNGTKDIHEESLNFQKRVRDIYLRVSRSDSRLEVVDCRNSNGLMQTPGEISSLIINLISDRKLI